MSCWSAELDPIFISVHCRFCTNSGFKNIKILFILEYWEFWQHIPSRYQRLSASFISPKPQPCPSAAPLSMLHKQHLYIHCSTSYRRCSATPGTSKQTWMLWVGKGWQWFLTVLEHFLWPGICAKHFTNTIWIRTNSDRLGSGECYSSPNILLSSQ